MAKKKPYETKIDRTLAIQLLNSSGEKFGDEMLGDALVRTAKQMADLAKTANKFLDESEFSGIVAEYLARKFNKRGHAEIDVSSEGHVCLIVSYDEKPKQPKTRTRRVPLLKELRATAKEQGVDITQFGTKRRAIYEHLQNTKAGVVVQPEPEPEPPTEDNGPMSAGPDSVRSSPVPVIKPPKKAVAAPVVTTSSGVIVDAGSTPKAPPKKDLRRLAAEAKEVDIAALIDSEAK
jgi:hypothetical protein